MHNCPGFAIIISIIGMCRSVQFGASACKSAEIIWKDGISMPKVTLIAWTPDPEKVVAAAAKLCYSSAGISEVTEGLTPEKTASFVRMISELGHESTVEHVSFTFGIEGVSRAFLAQITRHRIASYSVKSQRYVDETDFEYIIPPAVAAIPEAKKEFLEAMEEDRCHYERISALLREKQEAELLAGGQDTKSASRAAQKLANEDARFVLPNACETKMICTFNARELLHFFSLRCCARAQWEIRSVADQMLALVKPVAPDIFAKAGPSCVSGPCPEGKMSCGRAAQVRERYLSMGANA